MPESYKNDRSSVFGWCMYDWASSAYATTILVAVLPNYFADVIMVEPITFAGQTFRATALWGFAVAAAAVLGFVAAPVLGAIADFTAAKKRFLLGFAWAGAACASLLYFCGAGQIWSTLGLFVVAQFAFISANIFYNAFLPQIVTEERYDAVSGYGFAAGFLGGGIQFALALALIKWHNAFGISQDLAARLAMVSACVWWGGFTIVTAFTLKERPRLMPLPERFRDKRHALAIIQAGFYQTWITTKRIGRLRQLLLFLIAFLLFNDGMQTVVTMATVYGTVELGLGRDFLMLMLLIIQGVAMVGSLVCGWLAGKLGAKRTLMLTLLVWTAAVVYAYFVQGQAGFFVLGMIIGFVLGGSPALARSLYSTLIPPEVSAEFFGFYTVFSKFSSIFGPLIFALIDTLTGSARASIVSLAIFFIAGLILLQFVNMDKGRQDREQLRQALRADGA